MPIVFTIFANPSGDLLLTQEQNGIQDALDPLVSAKKIEHLNRTSASHEDFFNLVRSRPKNAFAILHFGGHAHQEVLQFQNTQVSFVELAKELLDHSRESLQLVFLNGCSTYPLVQSLFDLGVPAVIATSVPVPDTKAKDLAIRFYQHIALGDSIQVAYQSAVRYVNSSELDSTQRIHESAQTRDILLGAASAQKTEFPWGLYIKEGQQGKGLGTVSLPQQLQDVLSSDQDALVQSLRQALRDQRVPVGRDKKDIFKYYGWMIESYLQKMMSPSGKVRTLRSLSFMTEAYHSSLRYLCYVQLAQILAWDKPPTQRTALSDFFFKSPEELEHFDYRALLVMTNTILQPTENYVQELPGFIEEMMDPDSDLFQTALFLDLHRTFLLKNEAVQAGDSFDKLWDEYLTALMFWLEKLSFLAHYRLVSINNIRLDYQLKTTRNFIHVYGELHGMYTDKDIGSNEGDFEEMSLENEFTYNRSVLLLKGSSVQSGLDNLLDGKPPLSLSPLVIDQSVYMDKPKQTPEIYCFAGYERAARVYHFAHYKNELQYAGIEKITSNKLLTTRVQNKQQLRLNTLYQQLNQLFAPYKPPTP